MQFTNICMKNFLCTAALLCGLLVAQSGWSQSIKILVNHIGYEPDAPKHAVVLGHATDKITAFSVIDEATGKSVLSGKAVMAGPVDHWKDWYFWTVDFSPIKKEGKYWVQ